MSSEIIDVHMHVGVKGDHWNSMGKISEWFQQRIVYKIMLLYAGIDPGDDRDEIFKKKTLEVIENSAVDKVVCLALDHVYTLNGDPNEEASHMWVSNEYIIQHLIKELPNKILLGASVHPYRDDFEDKIKEYKDKGAVLLKWIPSAQQINLASDKVKNALKILAENTIPLLLHVGPEYAIYSTDLRTKSYDFLSWRFHDKVANTFRFKKKWFVPDIQKINENIKIFLAQGGKIIFAHCGLPYYVSGWIGKLFEHSDFSKVKEYICSNKNGSPQCFADTSAIITPFRQAYFKKIKKLPANSLLFGSDYPTPVFELSVDLEENLEDFKAILKGDLKRIIIPEGNLIDVNLEEMKKIFPNHMMFTNFNQFLWNNHN